MFVLCWWGCSQANKLRAQNATLLKTQKKLEEEIEQPLGCGRTPPFGFRFGQHVQSMVRLGGTWGTHQISHVP